MKKIVLIIFLVSFAVPAWAAPPYVFGDFNARQKKKEESRWTLESWLAQKQQFRMMDYWLAMNTSANIFEGYIGGSYSDFEVNSEGPISFDGDDVLSRAHLGLFLTIFGLRGEWEKTDNEIETFSAEFVLRLLGPAEQASNVNLFYGQRIQNFDTQIVGPENLEFKNNYYGIDVSLYISKYFGLYGQYKIFQEAEADSNEKLSGSSTKAGLFVDISFIRIYGNWFEEPSEFVDDFVAGTTEFTREGVEAGLRLFF